MIDKYLEKVDNSVFYRSDFPDVDVIRVGDTYYAITTTMHFFPGAEILASKDLIHWKHETYVYETLDSTPSQRLEGGNVYGKGMWAASLRFHEGKFYVCFVANDTGKTYLYTSNDIKGPWARQNIEGFYHDASLLFDDDGRVYIIYGNRNVYITELNESLTAPKEGGLNKLLVSDKDNKMLGYEGASALKIDGTYYFFFIHSLSDRWRRVEACFYTDDLNGELTGGDICDQDLGYKGSGVAQGTIVDTPDGKWYAILFQDRGASGRTPVILPMHFEGKQPVIDDAMSLDIECESEKEAGFIDEFKCDTLNAEWQWNHEPTMSLVELGERAGGLKIKTGELENTLTEVKNVLTHRLIFPYTKAEVTLDASKLNEGDFAGLSAFLADFGAVAVTKEDGAFKAKLLGMDSTDDIIIENPSDVRLSAEFFFGGNEEYALFYVNGMRLGGKKPISFKLDHFCGTRAALFVYSTKKAGGYATFKDFSLTWD